MTTGSQGESMSALSRMASGEFKDVSVGENDCIVISASPIPGNEKSVYNIINKLYKRGCDVIYDDLADVHVSGHACQEEIKTIPS
jgi:ribonuclease J